MNEEFDKKVDWPPIDETETDLCRTLWLAVAAQALVDAVGESSTSGGSFAKASAQRWLAGKGENGADFEMVCRLAGMEPKKLRRRFNDLLEKKESIYLRSLRKEAPQNKGLESRQKYLRRARRNERIRAALAERKLANQRRKKHA